MIRYCRRVSNILFVFCVFLIVSCYDLFFQNDLDLQIEEKDKTVLELRVSIQMVECIL